MTIFSTSHILLTGLASGALAAVLAAWRLRTNGQTVDWAAIGVLTTVAVFLLRKSANMPQLNDDGLQGFSANDWLAPAVTFVVVSLYGSVRREGHERRFGQARALATIAAFVINVITI
jgi:NADH:ubiquinone oxidoreductase subunit H